MYRPHSDEIRELRKRGLPWLASALLLLLLLIFGITIFIVLENQNESNKNLLFRWKYGSFEYYDDDEGNNENGSLIFISPLRKHGKSDDSKSQEFSGEILFPTRDTPIVISSTSTYNSSQVEAILTTESIPTQSTTTTTPPVTEPNILSTPTSENVTNRESTQFVDSQLIISTESSTTTLPVQIPIFINQTNTSTISNPIPSTTISTSSIEGDSRGWNTTSLSTSSPLKIELPLTTSISVDESEEEEINTNLINSELEMTDEANETLTELLREANEELSEVNNIPLKESIPIGGSEEKSFAKAAVLCTEESCSEIGRNILLRGGNSIDAAIAADFCMGSTQPHKAGLGASTIMLIHRPGSEPIVINGLSSAPRSATFNTFAFNRMLSRKGYSSIGCPGNLAVLWNAFSRYGSRKLKWQDLILPTIEILERGFEPTKELSNAFGRLLADQKLDPVVRKRFGGVLSNRTMYRNDPLAQTLRKLASSRDPYQLFYRGDIASQITQEIRSLGAILTKLDFINYVANIEDAITVPLDEGRSILGFPPPLTSLITQLSVSHIIKKFSLNADNIGRDEMVSDLVSFQKKAESLRAEIADPTFSPNLHGSDGEVTHEFLNALREKYGQKLEIKRQKRGSAKMDVIRRVSSNIHVIDSTGVAVSLTSSLNGEFGAQRLSNRLGFFWNNFMAEFTLGESESDDWNSVQGSKRPRSSISPLMIVKNDEIELMISSSNAICFDSILTQAVLNYLLLEKQKSKIFPLTCDLSSSNIELSHMRLNENVSSDISLLYKKNNLIYSVCDSKEPNMVCTSGF